MIIHKNDRLTYILHSAMDTGYVSISDMSKQLGVSEATIRRDIHILCNQNKLKKIRGGAYPVKTQIRQEVNYMIRKRKNEQIKYCIGREAAHMIRDGNVVFLAAGVSTEAIAEAISNVHGVTFVTNSISIASMLVMKCSYREITGHVIIPGGEIDIQNRYMMGTTSVKNLDHFHFDLAFISCTAIAQPEVFAAYLDEGYTAEHILKHTKNAILIAESEKFGKRAVYKCALTTDFSHIITDNSNPIPDYIKEQIALSKTKFVIVDIEDQM